MIITLTDQKKKGILINGLPFYLFVKTDELGRILQVFEKPDLTQINWHVFGEHRIVGNPAENHYDHTSGGLTWKEYPQKEGRQFKSKYIINESVLGIAHHWDKSAIVNQLSSSVGLLDSGATKQPQDFVGLL